ncbi:DNA (cytosine-5-)-methyltransferase, partial [Enterococcus faecalis]
SEAVSPTITCNHGEGSKIAIPILAPNKKKVRQNGRRCKENDEEMFTHTAQHRHGIIVEGNLDGGYRSASSVVSTDGISPT